jgi:gluconate kinase
LFDEALTPSRIDDELRIVNGYPLSDDERKGYFEKIETLLDRCRRVREKLECLETRWR